MKPDKHEFSKCGHLEECPLWYFKNKTSKYLCWIDNKSLKLIYYSIRRDKRTHLEIKDWVTKLDIMDPILIAWDTKMIKIEERLRLIENEAARRGFLLA